MQKYFYFLFKLIILFTLSGFQVVIADDSVTPLDNFLKELENFQANFRQTLVNEHGEALETSTGTVYMQNPGKFRWDYKDPYSQLIITDGQTLWLYDEDLEQVTIRDISGSIENTPAAILGGKENIDEHFIVIDLGDIEGFNWTELTPRNIDNQYNNIRLGFDGKKLGMMVLSDNLGQTTRIDFIDSKRNENIDPSLFTFEPPAGVDIIDDRS